MLFADIDPAATLKDAITLGVLLFLQQLWANWKANRDKAELATKTEAAAIEVKKVAEETKNAVAKVEKIVNGTSKPDENPRGLTGMMEELTTTVGEVKTRFDAHESLDNERHVDNLKAIADGQKISREHTQALNALSGKVLGRGPQSGHT